MPPPLSSPEQSSTSSLTRDVTLGSGIVADYVEARTAAVFAGACHYNGEYVTTGRDALMAWNFTAGEWNNVSLGGVRIVAAVTSEKNLSDASPTRKVEFAINPEASGEQVEAAVALVKSKCDDTLGTVAKIRRLPITFKRTESGYDVDAKTFGTLRVKFLPDNSCCTQPGDVWYEPLTPLRNRKVGYTETATFNGSVCAPWHRSDENSAFYGQAQF